MKLKNQQGFTVLEVALIVLLIVAIVGAAYYVGANKNKSDTSENLKTTQRTSSKSKDDMSDWKTYSDTVNKSSFKYPSDWQVATEELDVGVEDSVVVDVTDPSGKVGITYTNFIAGRGAPTCPEDMPCPIINILDITKVAGVPSAKYVEYIAKDEDSNTYNIDFGLVNSEIANRLSLGEKAQNYFFFDMGLSGNGASITLRGDLSLTTSFSSSEEAKKYLKRADVGVARKIVQSIQVR